MAVRRKNDGGRSTRGERYAEISPAIADFANGLSEDQKSEILRRLDSDIRARGAIATQSADAERERQIELLIKILNDLVKMGPAFKATMRAMQKRFGLSTKTDEKKVDRSDSGALGFQPYPHTSEGPIARKRGGTSKEHKKVAARAIDTSKLPENPRLWNYDFRGKSSGERDTALLTFLEDVYGPYMPAHRDNIREYLIQKDERLYSALKVYGFKNLPEKFKMPSRRERLQERIKRAASGEYSDMTVAERRSVRWGTKPGKPPRPKS